MAVKKPQRLTLTYSVDATQGPSGIYKPDQLTITPLYTFIRPQSFDANTFGVTRLTLSQIIVPAGLLSTEFGSSNLRNENQFLVVSGTNVSSIGLAHAWNADRYITAIGLGASALPNNHFIFNLHNYLKISGFISTIFGTHHLRNLNRQYSAPSFVATTYGLARIYNLRQNIQNVGGYGAASYGTAYLQGGVKYINLNNLGIGAAQYGLVTVINTRPDQFANLANKGIAPPFVSGPNVSPRILYTFGITPAPFGTAWVSNARRMVYAAPLVTHNFGDPYSYTEVVLRDREVTPKPFGEDTWHGFGSPEVWMTTQWVTPSSLWPPYFGPGSNVWNNRAKVTPQSMQMSTYGTAWVSLHRRVVSNAGGIKLTPVLGHAWFSLYTRSLFLAGVKSASVLGTHTIEDRAKYPKPVGLPSTVYGLAWVSSEYQDIYGRGLGSYVSGSGAVRLGTRFVEPTWIYAFRSGYGWLADGVRYISVDSVAGTGLVASRAWISDRTQVKNMRGFDSAYINEHARVEDPLRRLFAQPALVENPQRPVVYNKNTYLSPLVFDGGQKGETVWGAGHIQHRNRVLVVGGIKNDRLGVGTAVYERVGDIHNAGGLDRANIPALLVAYAVRPVYMNTWDSLQLSAFAHIRNLGLGVYTTSFGGAVYGQPTLVLANRSLRIPPVTLDDALYLFGTTIVGFAKQEVAPVLRNRPMSYFSNDAWVSLGHRTIQPAAIDVPVVVRYDMEVVTRFTYIRQFWRDAHVTPFGDVEIALKNRVVAIKAWPAQEESKHAVVLRDQELFITVGESLRMGFVRIGDRRTVVDLYNKGLSPYALVRTHKIQNVEADPPTLQKVFATGVWAFSTAPHMQVSEPRIGEQRIEDVGGQLYFKVGSHEVRSNVIEVTPMQWRAQMGEPMVSPFYIRPKSLGEHLGVEALGKPWVNPYHIYAPQSTETPLNYRVAHPEVEVLNHPIDGRMYRDHDQWAGYNTTKIGTAWVPRPIVTHWVQRRGVQSFGETYFGRSEVAHKFVAGVHYIRPAGLYSLRMGWLRFPPDILEPFAIISSGFGRAGLHIPRSNILAPSGLAPGAFPGQSLDFYHRFLKVAGWDSQRQGTAWASYRVRAFAPMGVLPTTVVSEYAYIDFKVRTLRPVGEVHLNPPSAYTNNPTIVKNYYIGAVVSVKAFSEAMMSVPVIAQKTQHVGPRALFAVPLFPPTVKGRTEVQALGAEHTEFGHVRKYEEGVIYPHEFGPVGFGQAFVGATREMQGFDSAVVECPVIAKHVGAYGTPGEQFGVTVFTNEVCCEGCG